MTVPVEPLLDASWVWPWWLERQRDPASPDFVVPAPAASAVPGAAVASAPANVTHLDWVLIGNLGTHERASVDPRGLVTSAPGGWSLDWWIGAEDRWHLPSREAAVRQHLLGGAPVVETALRVPGGDAIHRAYAMQSTALGPCAVVEIENRTAVPFAVALSVRPAHAAGSGPVSRIEVDGRSVWVDGALGLVLSKPPAHVALANGADGDCASTVFAGAAPGGAAASVQCPDGWASGAFVVPLAHTAIVRAVLPLGGSRASARSAARSAPRSAPRSASVPVARRAARPTGARPVDIDDGFGAVPSAEQVAKGWDTHLRRGMRVELPAPLGEAVDAARCHLLLAHAGEDLVWWPPRPFDFAAAAPILHALDVWGFHDEVEQVLSSWPERQALDGSFLGAASRGDAPGAALAALGRHWAITRDDPEPFVALVAKAAHGIERKRSRRRARRDERATGLVPGGAQPEWIGSPGVFFRDSALAVRGLSEVAPMLDAAGQPEVADDVRRCAEGLRADLDRALGAAREANGGMLPAGPDRRLDAHVVANLSLPAPFGCLAPDDPGIAATLDHVRERWTAGPDGVAVVHAAGGAGLSPALTLLLALAEIERGEPAALARLSWAVAAGGPCSRWPTALHPRTGGGTLDQGSDPLAVALVLLTVRQVLLREHDGGLVLLSPFAPEWIGHPFEVHDAPCAFGRISFALRWHGERPALLWELDAHDGVGPVTLTAPGLDPGWSATAPRGEALLAATERPTEAGPLTETGPAAEAGALTEARPLTEAGGSLS